LSSISFYFAIPDTGLLHLRAEPFLGLRYPPYSQQAFEILTAGVNAPIPAPNSS
jgi:hypothetical protein